MEWMDPMPAVLSVLAVVAGTLWWLGRKGMVRLNRPGSRKKPRRLESVERLTLGPHHVLHLVSLDGRTILVGQSQAGLSLVDSREPAAASLRAAAADRG
jgi:hypothetical protein